MKRKIMLLVIAAAIESALLVWFLYIPKFKEHKQLETELAKLITEVEEKTRTANNLPIIQREYDRLNSELKQALTELPNSREIPSLLTGITTQGKNAGLDFLIFRPKGEIPKDFYAEVPVDITVSGTYLSVANFFADVAKLPRIVNINNVVFSDIKSASDKTTAKVSCLATTFRFLDKKEIKDEKKPAKK